MNVLVLGSGLIGRPMAIDLATDKMFNVSIADISSQNLDRIPSELPITKIRKDLSDPDQLKSLLQNFDIVLSSPLTRAVQTAEIISKNIQPVPEVIKENNLGIGSRTSDLIDLLNGMDFKNIAVVGHQPDLSHHIINFCGTGNFNLVFPPAALAKIEFENSIKSAKGKLVYLIPPIVQL